MLSISNLTKYFDSFKALDAISFSVKKGKIVGLLGPNGAGKTTTIRIITGVLPRTSGEILLDGQDLDPTSKEWKLQFGIVPETTNSYLDYSPLKNMMFSGRLYGLSKHYCKERALSLLKEFGLADKIHLVTKKLSKGQKQRLNLSMALLHDPQYLFLDEPTTGLDVNSAQLLRKRIQEFKKEGKTIFLTTHNMLEANILCDEIIILNKGKILAVGSPETLRKKFMPASKIELELRNFPENTSIFQQLNLDYQIKPVENKVTFFSTNPAEDFVQIQDILKSQAAQIMQCHISPASLEEIFLKILGEN
ncbi:MAG: ABC transporter ATP-binding protein [Candidatus Helarchaeota archaeon]